MDNKTLFTPYTLGNIKLKNRVVMAPMTRSRATQDHVPTDLMKTYYEQRAGAGLIITEGTAPSANGAGYPRIPGIYNEEQTQAWKKITQAVQEKGSRIFIQLMHTGRISHPLNFSEEFPVVAPSAIRAETTQMYTDQEGMKELPTPKEMSKEEIEQAVQEYVKASENALLAGFDGVELHGANGYLLEQFLYPGSNQRFDEYGGSVENRARFVLDVVKAVTEKIGSDKVGIRLSPYGAFNDITPYGETHETFTYLAEELGKFGLLYIHLVDHSSMGAPEVPQEIKETIKSKFGRDIILSGGYDAESAEKDLQAGKGELVAFGKPFISNPDLVERMQQGADLAEFDMNTFYTPGAEGYTDYPVLEEVK